MLSPAVIRRRTERAERLREKALNRPPLPSGVFNIIYADPPWKYDFHTEDTRAIEAHYPTMPTEEICSLKIPAAEDAILFLWVTAPKNREAFRVMDAWGFEYKTQMVWVKDRIGMGMHVRNQHELLLIGTKGSPALPPYERRPPSIIKAKRREHSQKPEVVYGIIEAMHPNCRYLELFARVHREGWAAWGDECPSSVQRLLIKEGGAP